MIFIMYHVIKVRMVNDYVLGLYNTVDELLTIYRLLLNILLTLTNLEIIASPFKATGNNGIYALCVFNYLTNSYEIFLLKTYSSILEWKITEQI